MSAPQVVPPPCQLPPPELSIHRDHCLALLHRYFRLSVEVGRLPALLGREIFRARARSYRLTSFEDVVIFVHDVERCLKRLHPFDQELIVRIVFQEYTEEEAATVMRICDRTIRRRFPEALDSLTEIFLTNGLLRPSTRRYRHLPPELAQASATVDLEGCAAELADLAHLPACDGVAVLSQNVVKPPFSPFFS